MGYTATIGMNLPPDDTRFEAGDTVPDALVEPWMADQGYVVTDTPAPATSTSAPAKPKAATKPKEAST